MVEADPDVPYAFACVIDKLGERRDLRELEALGHPLRTEDGRARSHPVFEPQQSPVLRIKVGEEAVADFEGRHLLRASGRKAHHRISAVAVVIDEKFRRVSGAVGAFRTQLQSRESIGCDIRVMRFHFAPGDITVSAVVQADREIEVAQGDVPLPAHVRTLCTDRQVTVTRLVRVRERGCKEKQQREQRSHRFRACSARARRRSRMSDFTQSTSNGMTSSGRPWSSRKSAYAASKNWSLIGSKYAARKCPSACFTSPCRNDISARRVSTQTLTSRGASAFLASAAERARWATAALPVVPSR